MQTIALSCPESSSTHYGYGNSINAQETDKQTINNFNVDHMSVNDVQTKLPHYSDNTFNKGHDSMPQWVISIAGGLGTIAVLAVLSFFWDAALSQNVTQTKT